MKEIEIELSEKLEYFSDKAVAFYRISVTCLIACLLLSVLCLLTVIPVVSLPAMFFLCGAGLGSFIAGANFERKYDAILKRGRLETYLIIDRKD